jgi:hypothetical protein
MKKILLVSLLILGLFSSCKEDQNEKEKILPASSGKINTLSVIIDAQLWKGEIGDSIRAKMAGAVDGLPQEEPLFSLKQYAPKLFNGFVATTRIALVIENGKTNLFEIRNNEFAQPQTVVHLYGETSGDIIRLLEENETKIIQSLKNREIAENQRRIKKSLLDDAKIQKKFGISLKMPDAYRYIMDEPGFFWIRKETQSGNNSILIYEVPIASLENNQDLIQNIIKMRDSIGAKHIEGTLPNTFMVTEESYAPFYFKINLANKDTHETKGTWELKNDYMAGPFINYAIKDEANNRFVVVEGFCYNPSSSKRDLMHELESIIKTVSFK